MTYDLGKECNVIWYIIMSLRNFPWGSNANMYKFSKWLGSKAFIDINWDTDLIENPHFAIAMAEIEPSRNSMNSILIV